MVDVTKVNGVLIDDIGKIMGMVVPVGVDVSDADAAVGDVKDPKTFYSVAAPRKTGTMPTVALDPGSSAYPAGYHIGDVGGLPAVDTDLVTANIKATKTIFNVPGDPNVVDTSSGDAAAGDIKTGKKAWVDGVEVTGNIPTVAIVAANDNYPAGYHAGNAGGLDAIDLDLASANIKSGVTIFGKLGTYAQTATHDIKADAVSTITCDTGTKSLYYKDVDVPASSDTDLATKTQTYAAGALTEALGYALVGGAIANKLKLRLYADGVQIGETAYIGSTYFYLMTVNGNKALSGSKIVKISVHNYDAVASISIMVCGVKTSSGCVGVAGVFAGSVKVV